MLYSSASSAGFRKGAHVVIIGPPHNNRKGGSAIDPHDGCTGIITREGSSSNGGWFELKLDITNELVYYRRGSLRVVGLSIIDSDDELYHQTPRNNTKHHQQQNKHITGQRDRTREREARRARAAADRSIDGNTMQSGTTTSSIASTELEELDSSSCIDDDATVDSTIAYSSDEFDSTYYIYQKNKSAVEHDIDDLQRAPRKRRRKQIPMRSIQSCGSPSFVCTLYNAVSIY